MLRLFSLLLLMPLIAIAVTNFQTQDDKPQSLLQQTLSDCRQEKPTLYEYTIEERLRRWREAKRSALKRERQKRCQTRSKSKHINESSAS